MMGIRERGRGYNNIHPKTQEAPLRLCLDYHTLV